MFATTQSAASTRSAASDIAHLIERVRTLNTPDAFLPRLTPEQWRQFAGYLTCHELASGEKLIVQGEVDRSMYLLGEGSVQVFVNAGTPGNRRVAIARAGSVLGEPALFTDAPRMANVEAMGPCVVWALRPQRFDELVARAPGLAVEILRAAGAVMAVRMASNLDQRFAAV